MSRGIPKKTKTEHEITIARQMVTRNYLMRWDLDRCVGCQIGPIVCPKGALTHVEAVLEDGHIVKRSSVDVDEKKCVNCGVCVVSCPTHAISLTINGKAEIPVIEYGAYPEFITKTIFQSFAHLVNPLVNITLYFGIIPFVFPMRRITLFSNFIHTRSSNLNFNPITTFTHYSRME